MSCFKLAVTGLIVGLLAADVALAAPAEMAAPTNDPSAGYRLPWTGQIRWTNVVNIRDFVGKRMADRLGAAQDALAAKGGGVVYFPAGTYAFEDDVLLRDGVTLRGQTPTGVTKAVDANYDPPARLVFPRYVPRFEGEGTPIATAFKGIHLADPAKANNCGVVNLSIDRGHIDLGRGPGYKVGRNRMIYGCVVRNAAVANGRIPDAAIGQHPWQRYTAGHHAAISVYTSENALVANCRLPRSGQENFIQKGYVILDRKKQKYAVDSPGVTFDYDMRPGIYVNAYSLGGAGHAEPDGTPETHPWGFRKGLVIRDNYVYCSGRSAIGFTGDGTYCGHNVIRFPEDLVLWTHTGTAIAWGNSTNGNRAVEMRGWRWTVEYNDYQVFRNRCAYTTMHCNDGEGLMHEDHANSLIRDSKLIGNRGNAYISIFGCGDIDGLEVRGNDIRPKGAGTDVKINTIFVLADRSAIGERCTIRNVSIIGNTTTGSGILIQGSPAENTFVRGNRNMGGIGPLINNAKAVLEGNEGYEVRTDTWKPPRKIRGRPRNTARPAAPASAPAGQ